MQEQVETSGNPAPGNCSCILLLVLKTVYE